MKKRNSLTWDDVRHYSLKITLLEDMHSGTGAGRHGIDAIQLHDRHGKPIIHKTHLQGLLLEKARELAQYDPSVKPESLFGERGKRTRRAILLQSLRLKDKGERLLWSSAAMELLRRNPARNTLRTIEYVAAGSTFVGEFCICDPQVKEVFERCLRRLTHIGSRRSRGDGLVKVEWQEIEQTATQKIPPIEGLRLRILLQNLDPLHLPVTGFPGNVIPSECFIRGQVLLGALANWGLSYGQDAEDLFARKISIGNALPLPDSVSQETIGDADILPKLDVIPIPANIYTPKPGGNEGDGQLPWWIGEAKKSFLGNRGEIDYFAGDSKRDSTHKRPKETEFLCCLGDEKWHRYQPQMSVHMRNQTRRDGQDGSLFAEEEIAENTLFMSELVFACEQTAKNFVDQFEPVLAGKSWLTIGRGGRTAKVIGGCWVPPQSKKTTCTEDSFRVTLESDLIARADNLGFHTTLTPSLLAELAGDNDGNKDQWDSTSESFCEAIEIRGFNSASGLPRSPSLAIRRGSSLLVKGEGCGKLYEALSQLDSLGERAWEGFGRFRLNFSPALLQSTEAGTARKKIEENATEEILQKAEKLAKDLVKEIPRGKIPPSKSQWHYLRQQVRHASDQNSIENIVSGLKQRAETLGGSSWKNVKLGLLADSIKECENRQQAIQLVDFTVRYLLLELKKLSKGKE